MFKEFPLGVIRDKDKGGCVNGTESDGSCGFGGQGVMTLGKFLAGGHLQLHGQERDVLPLLRRGQQGRHRQLLCGHLRRRHRRAAGRPMDDLIVMNDPSLNKFLYKLVPGGTLFINSSIVKSDITRSDIKVVKAPVTELALGWAAPRC